MSVPDVATELRNALVIPILRRMPEQDLINVADAVIAGGVQAIEVTLDSPGALSAIGRLRERHGYAVLVGAGTVMTETEFRDAQAAGAQFCLSPHLDTALVQEASRSGCVFIPGVLTPSEIVLADRAGAAFLKLFPAGALGTPYLSDLLGPFRGKEFFPTGGITPENAPAFIRAGATGVGMGSALVQRDAVERRVWGEISERVRHVVQALRNVKQDEQSVVLR